MKLKSLIKEMWKEDDGWFIQLIAGWTVDDSTAIREDTKAKALARLKDAKFTGLQ